VASLFAANLAVNVADFAPLPLLNLHKTAKKIRVLPHGKWGDCLRWFPQKNKRHSGKMQETGRG